MKIDMQLVENLKKDKHRINTQETTRNKRKITKTTRKYNNIEE